MQARHQSLTPWPGLPAFDELADILGLGTQAEKAAWLGIAESTFNRVARGITQPGQKFIGCTMEAIADEPRIKDHPAATYERLFPKRARVPRARVSS